MLFAITENHIFIHIRAEGAGSSKISLRRLLRENRNTGATRRRKISILFDTIVWYIPPRLGIKIQQHWVFRLDHEVTQELLTKIQQ